MTHIALGAGLRGRDAAECAAPLFKTRKLIEGRARGRQQNHGIVTGGILGGARRSLRQVATQLDIDAIGKLPSKVIADSPIK